MKNQILSEIARVFKNISLSKRRKLVSEIVNAKSVCVVGYGRSGYVAKSFAMRLGHLGIKKGGGLLIAISGSGKTKKTLEIVKKARKSRVVCITMNRNSSVARVSDLVIVLKARKSSQPLRSLFEQSALIYLDGVVMLLMKQLKVSEKKMWRRHE